MNPQSEVSSDDTAVAPVIGQPTHFEYQRDSDKIKFCFLIGLTIYSWLTIFLLCWIIFLLESHPLSSARAPEPNPRQTTPVPAEPPHEMPPVPVVRNVS